MQSRASSLLVLISLVTRKRVREVQGKTLPLPSMARNVENISSLVKLVDLEYSLTVPYTVESTCPIDYADCVYLPAY